MSATYRVLCGDVREKLRELDDESIHCCITSPPYYGLRDYGTGTWEGGDPACEHVKRDLTEQANLADSTASSRGGASSREEADPLRYGHVCALCGAIRTDQQIGLEETPDAYVESMVEVFREVRRVLRHDGTVWLNLGDSYAGSWGAQSRGQSSSSVVSPGTMSARQIRAHPRGQARTGSIPDGASYKPKDLLGIPWMVAFALRADGWYLRSEIIWAKPNPMPESITDRPTKGHEQVFLLAKSPRYYYDAEAIREPSTGDTLNDLTVAARDARMPGAPPQNGNRKSKRPDGWASHAGDHGTIHKDGRERGAPAVIRSGRNKRSVWEIATRPYPDAHFAAFPPRLIEPMVLAGAAPQTCIECSAPWRRVTEVEYENPGNRTTNGPRSEERKHEEFGTAGYAQRLERRSSTVGWEPTCDHAQGGGRSVVLDPFAGSGTTLQVAVEHGRDAVGIELNEDYIELIQGRLAGVTAPLFALS